MKSPRLNATQLLDGALYAIEHAGNLLHDAVALYEQGRYASAVVLAVYCREELGRFEILLEIWKQTADTGGPTVKAVREKCEDHITKLKRGQMVVTTRLGADQGRKLLELRKTPTSKEYLEYRSLIDATIKQKARRDPVTVHKRRIRALYVDPDDEGGWIRPREESPSDTRELLDEIAGDYALSLDRLDLDDPELKEAIAVWDDYPDLPPPVSPA
jgi:AbiV family abortive infection protein